MKTKWTTWNALPNGKLKAFAKMFSANKSDKLISNVDTELRILQVSGKDFFPVTINNNEWNNSFVCSPYNAYAQYSADELKLKIKHRFIQFPLLFIIRLLSKYLKYSDIDKNVHINNYSLSTNPYFEWNGEQIAELTTVVKQTYPNHAIIFRSLNTYQHQSLLNEFQSNDYQLLGSRQVYIFDENYKDWWKRNNNKNDARIIKKQGLKRIGHDEMKSYLEEALDLYNQLYLKKYSVHNPQFTLAYFQQCHLDKIIHFQGFIDDKNQLKAFAGLFIIGNTLTSPLVGYDTNESIKKGLYIHAIRLIMEYKFESDLILNLSSGAPLFKRLRGGKPSIEYSSIYIKHLNNKRRFAWNCIIFLSNRIGVPLIEKYKL